MPINKIKVHKLANNIQKQWPKPLILAIKQYWGNTLEDDKNGLISELVFEILPKHPNRQQINLATSLGAASLYLWTAANLQDDIIDNKKLKQKNILLAKACWESANCLSSVVHLPKQNKTTLYKLSLQEINANLLEIISPKIIPDGVCAPSNKSLFLLISPLSLSIVLNWPKIDQNRLLKAGRYLLAAKQLADDLYDYREDWQSGRRNFAHRGLSQLPRKKDLPDYYRSQALAILKICQKCRKTIKTVSPLLGKNCFNNLLEPLETNCLRGLAKINQWEESNYKSTKS